MVALRSPVRSDSAKIKEVHEKFHEEDFPLPSYDNVLADAVADNGQGLIAYGMVKVLAELILISDKDKPLRDRMNALDMLVKAAVSQAKEIGLEQLYITVSDPRFSELLKKHFGFKTVKAESLVLNL